MSDYYTKLLIEDALNKVQDFILKLC